MNMRTIDDLSNKTDERGRLRIAGLHDAQLSAFTYRYREKMEFSLLGGNNEATHFMITKPLVLNIESLWEGSIVDTIYSWKADGVPEAIWNERENGWNALLERRIDVAARRKEADRLAMLHPEAFLLIVTCSYGGNWSVLGQGISIAEA